ncbi:MAG TPA: hypothetical protein VFB33_01885 [Candidatus Binataceae bacterium]|nr:hypothetical protein [Candidatus Binataceae bacterium]
MKIDFQMADEREVVIFTPLTERAHRWLSANVAEDRLWFGPSLMIDPEFADVLVNEMLTDGLTFVAGPKDYPQ